MLGSATYPDSYLARRGAMNNGDKDTDFQVGEVVLVRDGPYAGFRGTVVEVRPQVLHIDVSVFGLPTRIEVAFASVDRAVASAT